MWSSQTPASFVLPDIECTVAGVIIQEEEEPAGGSSTVLVRRNQGLLLFAERDYKGVYCHTMTGLPTLVSAVFCWTNR